MRLLPTFIAFLISGCMFQNVGPTQKLNDVVTTLNDDARWGRIALAAENVHPDFRPQFIASRRAWGRNIEVADMELIHVRIADDQESATAILTLSWYALDTMELVQTTLKQTYRRGVIGFSLVGEEIADGEPSLLANTSESAAAGSTHDGA